MLSDAETSIRAAFMTVLSVEPTDDELAVVAGSFLGLTDETRRKSGIRPNPESARRIPR